MKADDEDYTREGLLEAVDWEKFGIDEIMQAVNGAEAAGIVQCSNPAERAMWRLLWDYKGKICRSP